MNRMEMGSAAPRERGRNGLACGVWGRAHAGGGSSASPMLYYTLKQVGAGVRRHHEHLTSDLAFSFCHGHPLWRPLMKLCQGVARRG